MPSHPSAARRRLHRDRVVAKRLEQARALSLTDPAEHVPGPVQSTVKLVVPAVSSLRVSRRHVLNGQTVKFSGRVRSVPIPAGGKLVQMEVLLSRRWQTFRTVRTDPSGRWVLPYRFARTRGEQSYRAEHLHRSVTIPYDEQLATMLDTGAYTLDALGRSSRVAIKRLGLAVAEQLK